MARIDDIVRSVDAMPALPAIASRAVSILSDASADPEAIKEIIRQDEALSMAVLRLANSATYGVPGKTFALKDAIVRLGSSTLTQIALTHQMSGLFKDSGAAYGLRRSALWGGALGGAHGAERLAQIHGFDDPELCFLGGLLRDIGKLAIDAYCGGTHMFVQMESANESFLDNERDTIGADHTEVGAALATHWGLPDRLVNAIRFHHQPPGPTEQEHDLLYDIIHVADAICLWAGLGIGDDGLGYRVSEHVRDSLMANRNQIEDIINYVSTQVARANTELKASFDMGESV